LAENPFMGIHLSRTVYLATLNSRSMGAFESTGAIDAHIER